MIKMIVIVHVCHLEDVCLEVLVVWQGKLRMAMNVSKLYGIEQMTSQYEAWWEFLGKVGLFGLNVTYRRWADHWPGYGIQISQGLCFELV